MGLGAIDIRQSPLPTVASPLGNSPAISQVRRLISQVANHNTVVLIQGESGSGKRLWPAHYIKTQSEQKLPLCLLTAALFQRTY